MGIFPSLPRPQGPATYWHAIRQKFILLHFGAFRQLLALKETYGQVPRNGLPLGAHSMISLMLARPFGDRHLLIHLVVPAPIGMLLNRQILLQSLDHRRFYDVHISPV